MAQDLSRGFLIVITGLPGTGKSGLARDLAKNFHLASFSKDGILEGLYDTIGIEPDASNLDKLRDATYVTLWYIVRRMMRSGRSVIIESNFNDEEHTAVIKKLAENAGFRIIQIHFTIDPKLAFERFLKRQGSARRHPGHPKRNTYEEYHAIFIEGKTPRLRIEGEPIIINSHTLNASTNTAVAQKLLKIAQASR